MLYDASAVHREILLSYRLLFAQSSHSRRLITHQLQRLQSQPGLDPVLTTLCTVPLRSLQCGPKRLPDIFPYSTMDVNGRLQESSTYSVHEDFPCFGSRLLSLQRFSSRQQPSRVKDLWRDRRNPLQWYTFWAVLVVGGISIVLSILQLLVGVAQLYFAAAPQTGPMSAGGQA